MLTLIFSPTLRYFSREVQQVLYSYLTDLERLRLLVSTSINNMEGDESPVEAGGTIEYVPPPVSMSESRLSVPFHIRFPLATTGAFIIGAALGISHGGKIAGMQFRAENAHRFPTNPTGWYLYHKRKNYVSMLGGMKEGLKMGSKIGFWAGGFFVAEEAVDRWRGKKDFLSTVVAGVTVAAGFSGRPWSMSPLLMFSSSLQDTN